MDEGNVTKVWHRPWTTEEMRQQSVNWNLAGDAGLLQNLQQFSQNLLTRTHACEKGLDSMMEQLCATTLEVQNVTNQFLSLANIQFVENRVYEDDETPTEERKDEENVSKEEQEAEALARVHQALVVGISVLDTMFDTLEVPESDSDEDERRPKTIVKFHDNGIIMRTKATYRRIIEGVRIISIGVRRILKPHDPYANRPLPYLIGSKEFMEDDRIGLGNLNDVEEMLLEKTEMQSTDSDSESDTVQHGMATKRARVSISNSGNSDMENEDNGISVGPLLGKQQKMSQDELDSDPENIFGKNGEENFGDADKVNTFASKLAAKLGNVTALESNGPPMMNANQASTQPSMVWEEENIDESDSLFSNKSSKLYGTTIGKGRSGGLFDDLEDADTGTLWGSKHDVPGSKKSNHRTEGSLFVTDDVNEDLFAAEDSAKIVEPSQNSLVQKYKNMNTSTPDDTVQSERKKLFNQDISGIGSPLFDPAGEGGDLFHSPKSELSEGFADSAEQTNSTKSGEKKMPAGAVSVFGGIDVFKSNLVRPYNGSEGSLPFGEKGLLFTSSNTSSGITTMSGSEDECSKRAAGKSLATAAVTITKATQSSKKLVSLFNDSDSGDEEVLFSSASSNSSRSHKSQGSGDTLAAPSEKCQQQKGIFENDDDLFGRKRDEPDFDIFNIKSEASLAPVKNLEYNNDDDLFKNHSVIPTTQSVGLEAPKVSSSSNAFNITKNDDPLDIFAFAEKQTMCESEMSISIKDSSPAPEECVVDNPSVFGNVKNTFYNLGALEDENLFANIPCVSQEHTQFENIKTGTLLSTNIFENETRSEFKIGGSSEAQLLPSNTLTNSKDVDIFRESIEAVNSVTHNSSIFQASKDLSAKMSQIKSSIPPSTSSSEQMQDSGNVTLQQNRDYNVSVVTKNETNYGSNSKLSILESAATGINYITGPEEQGEMAPERNFKTKTLGSTGACKPEPPKTLNIRKTTELFFRSSSVTNGQASTSPECKGVSSNESKDNKSASRSSVSDIITALMEDEKIDHGNTVPTKRSPKEKGMPAPDKSNPEGSFGEVKSKRSPDTDAVAAYPNVSSSPQSNSEGAVGFDHPAQLSNTLHSAGKNRARIQTKRRPQSRRARHEAIRASDPVLEEVSEDTLPAENTSRNYSQNVASLVKHEKQGLSFLDPGKQVSLSYKENPSSSVPAIGESGGSGTLYAISNPLSPSTDEEDLFGVPPDLPSEYDNSQNLFTSAPVLSPLDLSSSITSNTAEDIPKLPTLAVQSKPELESSTTNDVSSIPPFNILACTLNKDVNICDTEKQTVSEGTVKNVNDSNEVPTSGSDSDDLFSEMKKSNSLLETVEKDLVGSLKGQDGLFTKDKFEPKKDVNDMLSNDSSVSSMTRYLIEESSENLIDDNLFISKTSPSMYQHSSFSSKKSKENLLTPKLDDVEENGKDLFAPSNDSLLNSVASAVKLEEEMNKTVTASSIDDNAEESLFSKMLSNSNANPGIKKAFLLKTDVEDIFANDDSENEDIFRAPASQSTVSKKSSSVKGTSSLFDDEDDDDIFRSAKTAYRGVTSKNDSDTVSSTHTAAQTSSRTGAANHTTLAKTEVKLFEDPLMAMKQ